jgi:hypothetical protein
MKGGDMMSDKMIPALKPQKITKDTYEFFDKCTVYKWELWDGEMHLNDEEVQPEDLLILLMSYVGLEKTVELASRELWLEALGVEKGGKSHRNYN